MTEPAKKRGRPARPKTEDSRQVRLSFGFNSKVQEQLEGIKQKTGAKDNSEIVRQAVMLLSEVLEAQDKGQALLVRDLKTNHETYIKLIL